MSDHKKSVSTVPSGKTTGTQQGTGSRHDQDSSSVNSSIQSDDRWRIGIPGPLPAFPLSTGPPPEAPAAKFGEIAVNIVTDRLTAGNFDWTKVMICGRVSNGHTVTETDTTLLIIR